MLSAGCAALFATPFANGIVVAQLLILTRSLRTARHADVARALAVLTVVVLPFSCAATATFSMWLPNAAPWLQLVALAAVTTAFAQFAGALLRRTQPLLALHLAPLVRGSLLIPAATCLVPALLLGTAGTGPTVSAAALQGLGAGLGFAVLLCLFADLRERDRAAAGTRSAALSSTAALHGLPRDFLTLVLLTVALGGFVNVLRSG